MIDILTRPDVRTLTRTVPGGRGQTRLAFALAATVTSDFPDSVAVGERRQLADPESAFIESRY